MPIPRQLFDQELDPLDQRILDILERNPTQAYSLNDLAAQLDLSPEDLITRADLIFRLGDLNRKRLIEARAIHGANYYAIVTR